MPFNLETQVVTLSSEDLDNLFKDSTPATAAATTTAAQTQPDNTPSNTDIPVLDLDTLDLSDTSSANATPPANAADTTPPVDDKKDDTQADAKPPLSDDVREVLKNTVTHLIENGLWEDFDDREKLEITEEVYAQLAIAQEQRKVESLFSDLIDSTGIYGKAILSHLKNGGNPDEIIDLFKEQKQVEAIDTKTEDGQIELIHRYYSEIVGWKPEKIKKHIQNLVSNPDEMKEEVGDISEKYDEYYQEQLQVIDHNQKQAEQAELRRQQIFSQSITKHINEREDLTDRDKKNLQRAILDFKHALPDGRKVNDFYVNIAQMQQDPQKFIDLVQFVTNKEAYDNKIRSKTETRVAEKTFKFLAGGAAANKKGSDATPNTTSSTDTIKSTRTDFSGLLKRK
jgi:PAS domain-containing protein